MRKISIFISLALLVTPVFVSGAGSVSVDVSSAGSIAFPAKDLTLFGHASDSQNAPVTTQWTEVNGPASVTFSAPWDTTTSVTFTTPGTYTFQLSASNGSTSGSANTTVVVSSAASQTAFYVDPTYTGGNNDGSAAHPWTSIHTNNQNNAIWNAINNALATNNVIVYFSSRQAGSDTAEVENREIDLWRTDTSTHMFTLDGMSKYNTNDTTGSWVDYSGGNKFNLNVITNASFSSSLAIGVQGDQSAFPMNYTTIRGFDTSGDTGRVLIAGNYATVEYVHVHNLYTNGANIMLQPPLSDSPACAMRFGPLRGITIRNNTVDHGWGEGIYLSGTYFKATQGGCPDKIGNSHTDILVEGNTVDQTNSDGGEPDDIDIKAGVTNITIRNNNLFGGYAGTRGIVSTGIFPHSTGPGTFTSAYDVKSNLLIEGNYIHDRGGAGIDIQNQNGAVIRNNILVSDAAFGINLIAPSDPLPYDISNDVKVYNNTFYNTPQAFSSNNATNVVFKNNLNIGSGPGGFSKLSSGTVSSDYNIYVQGGGLGGGWVEGPNSQAVSSGASFFVSPGSNFQLLSNSTAVDRGTNLTSTGFSNDYSGLSRPQGQAWDVGAYEYPGGGTNPVPPPVPPPVTPPVTPPTPPPTPPGSPDTTPPVISSVTISVITSTTATVTWTTNEPASSQIDFGVTTAYGSQTALVSTLTTSHSQNIVGMSPGTVYNIRVRGIDAANNLGLSSNNTLTTAASGSPTPPPPPPPPVTPPTPPTPPSSGGGGTPPPPPPPPATPITSIDISNVQYTAYQPINVTPATTTSIGGGSMTLDQLRALLAQLLAQVATLEARLAALKGTSGTSSTLTATRTLYIGVSGQDVTSLQQILVAKGYLSSDGITGFFGSLTQAAVRKYQCAVLSLCSGSENSTGWGVVGQMTRSALSK